MERDHLPLGHADIAPLRRQVLDANTFAARDRALADYFWGVRANAAAEVTHELERLAVFHTDPIARLAFDLAQARLQIALTTRDDLNNE